MATCTPFNCFALDIGKGLHHLNTDVIKAYLTNSAPNVATNLVYGDVADLATAGGYTAGGITLGANTWSQVGGLASLVAGANLVYTATTGFGPFRYAVLYNFTAAAKNLIGFYDNGASVSIPAAQTFEVDFSPAVLTLQF